MTTCSTLAGFPSPKRPPLVLLGLIDVRRMGGAAESDLVDLRFRRDAVGGFLGVVVVVSWLARITSHALS